MPEYSVAYIRRRYIDYLISAQKYSADVMVQYGIDLSDEFPLVEKTYQAKVLPNTDCSMWLCESYTSDAENEIERVYHNFQTEFENERGITLFQALTVYSNPFFVIQNDVRNNQFIDKVHRFNEDHHLEEEYIWFEKEFLRIYAILDGTIENAWWIAEEFDVTKD